MSARASPVVASITNHPAAYNQGMVVETREEMANRSA